jgi:hypothetical protein
VVFSRASRKTLSLSFLSFFSVTLFLSHQRLTLFENETGAEKAFMILPKAEHIRPFLLGHEAFVADLVWIRTLGYFADEISQTRQFTYLEKLIDLATDLDPRFEKIYIWAGAAMMYNAGAISNEKIMTSTRILEKGWNFIQNDPVSWRHDDRYWMIPQMIGFNYAIELHDREKGAPYIVAAARIPGSPPLYKTWAASLYSRAGKLEKSTGVLEDMLSVEALEGQLESAGDQTLKNRIRERLGGYYARLYGGAEARRRLEEIERKLENLRRRWVQSMPYVRFQFFFLLSETEEETSATTGDVWNELFPLFTGPN